MFSVFELGNFLFQLSTRWISRVRIVIFAKFYWGSTYPTKEALALVKQDFRKLLFQVPEKVNSLILLGYSKAKKRMFFRKPEKYGVLNLTVDEVHGGELATGVLVSSQTTPTVEDKVKQHFEQMREPLARYLTSTFGGERAQAEEITQDAFLQLYTYMARGHVIENVRAWTYRVAHNMAIKSLKRQNFLAPLDDEEWEDLQHSLAGNELNPEQSLLQKERLNRLRIAVGRLTPVERECLNLRTKGFRYKEIGAIVDITPRTVASTLYRVIEKLARETNE